MLLKNDHYINQIETDEIIVSLRNDGIVHVWIKPKTHITIEVQERMLAAYHKITDIGRPFIFEAGEFASISKEARLNAVLIEDLTPVMASAIVVKNLGHRIIAEYYYKFNKPKKPLRIFKNTEEAANWHLENFPD